MTDRTIIKPNELINTQIYAYTLPEVPNHNEYIKVGETSRVVEKRISEQTGTAGLNPKILFTKLAKKSDGIWFHDKELHRFFRLNNIDKKNFNGTADEWFYFNGTPEKAEELTDKFINKDYDEVQISDHQIDYILRNEQSKAVEVTKAYIDSKENPREFLWNAKPRFGKTLTTYDLARKLNAANILIVTNRPAIANSWFDDFQKFVAWQEPNMKFVSEADALKEKALSRKEFLNVMEEDSSQVAFISLQDLKGAAFAGGGYEKLDWVGKLHWDLLVIDEAHEGVDTAKTDKAFDRIDRDFTLHLSGTPFKALADNKFNEDQIFNWSYVDEQEAKENWDYIVASNPYENLPTLSLFTYQMSEVIEGQAKEGLTLDDDKNVDFAFDLNEFFKTKGEGKFEHEYDVWNFLNNLSDGKFPFATTQHREELAHTFWLLPRVASAKALEKILRDHPVFSEYKVILAAGDGISIPDEDNLEEDGTDIKSNEKSFDKVRQAIKENDKTITLSVGQLTTGVTIPEWSAVIMLNNIKSPSLYFQAGFRAQNPYEFVKNGQLYRKENAYIFDFAPERTLQLFDEFAINLSGEKKKPTDEQRKKKIKEFLNFFPVIGEDETGEMKELDATEVLKIPNNIKATEVVKRGFMSNLLFANVAGIFSAPAVVREILGKIAPEKNRRFEDKRELVDTKLMVNDDGRVDVPNEIVINTSKDIFGNAIFTVKEEPEAYVTAPIRTVTKTFADALETRFSNFGTYFGLSKTQTNKVKAEMKEDIQSVVTETNAGYQTQVATLGKEYTEQKSQAVTEAEKILLDHQHEEKKREVAKTLAKEQDEAVQVVIDKKVKKQIEETEEKKKKTTEDDVRDHLRGFARTIPSFLMAYGDESTTLGTFDSKIDEDTFLELTSITLDEFRKLRDGFDYVDESGNNQKFKGMFDEIVFNAAINEFFETKNKLANYFDDTLKGDIFDYIPPQKTNQIYTPKAVVKKMVDLLEKENPDVFAKADTKFIDLYTKSGLYIAELVKRLNVGLAKQIPNESERIKWILENQVYACAPTNIIFNIAKNFVFGNFEGIDTSHFVECDLTEDAQNKTVLGKLRKTFGDETLKFDVVIGNPPYQSENVGDNRQAQPIYHLFMEESFKIAEKVEFITPARFLANTGATPKAWNKKILGDKHLKVEYFNPNSAEVFPNTAIKGGVVVTYRDSEKDFGEIDTFVPFVELSSAFHKVKNRNEGNIDELLYSPDSYRFTDRLFEENPNLIGRTDKSHAKAVSSNVFERYNEIFFNEKPDREEYAQIFGRENNQRVFKYVKKSYIADHPNLEKWKVFVPGANGSGMIGELISTPLIGEPLIGHNQTFISIGNFNTKFEAESLLKYIKSKFARAMLGIMKTTQNNQSKNTWSKIPLQNFKPNSDIDWTKSVAYIDKQLYKKYGLEKVEIDFIEEKVQSME